MRQALLHILVACLTIAIASPPVASAANLRPTTPNPSPADTFLDTFDDGDAQGWVAGAGAWTVHSALHGMVYAQTLDSGGSRGLYTSLYTARQFSDFTYSADITSTSSVTPGSFNVGVAFRATNALNYYRVVFHPLWTGGQLRAERVVNGVSYALTSNIAFATLPIANHIEIQAAGSSFGAYVNGALVTAWSDSAYPVGHIGLTTENGSADFDNVLVVPTLNCADLADRDGDGLPNGWENCGYDANSDGSPDVDLPTMGASAFHKDIFVELDYMAAAIGEDRSHRPRKYSIDTVVSAFDAAPVMNVDGTTGIHLHVDYGADAVLTWGAVPVWGALSQSEMLPHAANLLTCDLFKTIQWEALDVIKGPHFADARRAIFHYGVYGHSLCASLADTSGASRGQPDNLQLGASDFVITLGGASEPVNESREAGTLMHELGHNLGLRHGGLDDVQYKPNYLSVMNYLFSRDGIIVDGAEVYDFSRYALPDLIEVALNETVGIGLPAQAGTAGTKWYCPTLGEFTLTVNMATVDWNCDGDSQDPWVAQDINHDGLPTILHSYEDWSRLDYDGGAIGGLGPGEAIPTLTVSQELTEVELAAMPDLTRVFLPRLER